MGVRRERDTKGPHGKKVDSNAKKKGHETRTKNVLDKKWEEGTKFDAKQNKYRAKKEVIQALGFWSGKSITRAVCILTNIISKFHKSCRRVCVELDEYALVSDKKAK